MTESRQVQETLRESEQLARGIIDTALDAFVQIDAQGVIRDWNTQAENFLGWRRDEALGRNAFELMGRPDGQGPLKMALQEKSRSLRKWEELLLPGAPPETALTSAV